MLCHRHENYLPRPLWSCYLDQRCFYRLTSHHKESFNKSSCNRLHLLTIIQFKVNKCISLAHTEKHTAHISTNVPGMLYTHLYVCPMFVSELSTKPLEARDAVTQLL